ncbi:cupin [Tardiphaga sp. 768_D3_N2_1]|uniref:cupin n=1 Tax=Tardiphaga sp. 768_D3_N2_1 TaxID=3240783 RepID=UPI003F8B0E9C
MPLKKQIENLGRKLVENRPDPETLVSSLRTRKPAAVFFADDGIIPNNPRFPMLLYRGAVTPATRKSDTATIIDNIFAENGWGRSWRDTVYDFVHYHSQVHEVLGVATGCAVLEFGGPKGRVLTIKQGDVVVLPAGTGHRLIKASRGFQVVGAYPAAGKYDECTDSRDRLDAVKRIARVQKPGSDPLYGKQGPLTGLWSASKRRQGK